MCDLASIPTLSLLKLSENEPDEQASLFNVCVSHGFFYLDYAGCSEWPSHAIKDLFTLGEKFFALRETEKMKISMESTGTYFGYKPRGANVVDDKGNRDQNEFLNISKTDIFDPGCLSYKSLGIVEDKNLESCRAFVLGSHSILNMVLSILSSILKLDDTEHLETFHRLEGQSGDHLRLVKYSPQPESSPSGTLSACSSVLLIPHTDFGTLTLLLTDTPGLQLMDPISKTWKFVEPRPDNAIVNVGDTLAKFTNGLFRSCQHRVVKMSNAELRPSSPEGARNPALKYSLGYFLRPEDEILLRRLNSNLIPKLENPFKEEQMLSKDWTNRRVNASKVSNFGKNTTWQDLKGTALVWK